MTNQEQENFISDLCNRIRDKGKRNVENMPQDWDGIELRQWLADEFATDRVMSRKEKNEYVNACRVIAFES